MNWIQIQFPGNRIELRRANLPQHSLSLYEHETQQTVFLSNSIGHVPMQMKCRANKCDKQ